MSKTAIVFTCAHADPNISNDRFDWLGSLIYDIKPDYVVDLGDFDDMKSLNSFDTRRPEALVTQSYERDIDVGQEGRDRIWHKFRHNKRKRPARYGFEGNHENRIKKALSYDPRLEGEVRGISFKHLNTNHWYDEYHEYKYSAPSIATYDGVSYAHYFSSGNFGSAVSGVHHAYTLLQNRNSSSTCGHSHKRSLYFKDGSHPKGIIGLVAGNFKGGPEAWAGQAQNDWWSGVIVKRNIEDGCYDPEFISMSALEREYRT